MFMQIINGPVADRDHFLREGARWYDEIRPDAIGYVGGVWGLTEDGTGLAVATFESEAAAEANGARPEQGEWWNAMEKAFTSVGFQDCTEVDALRDGIADSAGFVQIIRSRAKDQDEARRMMAEDADRILASRPDILGGLMGWHGDGGGFTQVMCFRSEAEARTGEMAMHAADLDQGYREMMAVEPEFIDVTDPHFD
jgi:hypothetical protein